MGYRYLELATTGTGQFGMKTGSQDVTIFGSVLLKLDQWYTATIIHNTADLIAEVYLDGKFIGERSQFLDHPDNDNVISNIDYSRGYSFSGYLRNLQVYSTSMPLASDENDFRIAKLNIFPNPYTSHMRINLSVERGMKYTSSDMNGRTVIEAAYKSDVIALNELPGMYMLSLYEGHALVN